MCLDYVTCASEPTGSDVIFTGVRQEVMSSAQGSELHYAYSVSAPCLFSYDITVTCSTLRVFFSSSLYVPKHPRALSLECFSELVNLFL